MLFDNPEDMGRAFNFTIKGSIYHLCAYHSKEAECWVRILKLVKDMNFFKIPLADKNPLIFEKEQIQNPIFPQKSPIQLRN